MAQDKLTILHPQINLTTLKTGLWFQHKFDDYIYFHKILLKNRPLKKTQKNIYIYDITHNTTLPLNTIIPINDHINRIGDNPFVGKQQFFKIDFINLEKLYLQTPEGVTTNSCGTKYYQHKQDILNPSTYLANIATIAYIHNYKIQAYLVNQYTKE